MNPRLSTSAPARLLAAALVLTPPALMGLAAGSAPPGDGAVVPDSAAGPVSVQVVAEPEPEPIRDQDPAALSVLDDAEFAIGELQSIRLTLQSTGIGVFKGTIDQGSVSIAARRKPDDLARWQVRMTGAVTPQRATTAISVDAAFDGNIMQWVDPDAKFVGARILPSRTPGVYFGVPSELINHLWFRADPFAIQRAAQRLTLEPRATIDGVECDVVRATMAEGSHYYVLYLGVEDHLPRRSVSGFDSRNLPGTPPLTGTATYDYLSLRPGAELGDADFILPVPDGFREENVPGRPLPTPPGGPTPMVPAGGDGSGDGNGDGSAVEDEEGIARQGEIAAAQANPQPRATVEIAQEFELKNQAGEIVRLSDLRGRPVLLLFWASWSPWAAELARELRPLLDEHTDVRTLVLAVRERSPETMRQRFDAASLPATLLPGADEVAGRYRIGAVPTLILIDSGGVVIHRHTGFDASASPIDELRRLLAQRASR